jgi:hypothetical protein
MSSNRIRILAQAVDDIQLAEFTNTVNSPSVKATRRSLAGDFRATSTTPRRRFVAEKTRTKNDAFLSLLDGFGRNRTRDEANEPLMSGGLGVGLVPSKLLSVPAGSNGYQATSVTSATSTAPPNTKIASKPVCAFSQIFPYPNRVEKTAHRLTSP